MTIEHPFAATLKQIRQDRGGGFANLNDQQKWEWHADTYAFEKIVLGREGSPCDPQGKWYNAAMVQIAERYYHAKFVEPRLRAQAVAEVDRWQGREAINRWAREQGHADIDSYAEGSGITLGEAYEAGTHAIIARTVAEKQRKFGYPRQNISDVRAALGLTAKEYCPTPEELRRGRIGLGLEDEVAEDAASEIKRQARRA